MAVCLLLLTSCGGGGGNNGVGPPPPPATFTLSLNPVSVALAQSGTQTVQILTTAQNGFSGSITITTNGLPSGVTISPSSLDLTAGTTGTLTLSATAGAAIGNVKLAINGASGSQQSSATLALDVLQTATPVAIPFTITGGYIIKAFYDESRQLLFVTNLYLNEVDVLSGQDLSIKARVPIAQPFGIDQMPDGNTLVVGTVTQGFYTINEDTLTTTRYLAPNFTQLLSTTVLLVPVAMSNGKVLFLSKDLGVADADANYPYHAEAIIEWDSGTRQFSMPFYVPYITVNVDNLKRSADRNWAAFAADKFYIYSSAQDSLVSSSVPMNNTSGFGVKDYAINSNGSEYAVVSPYSVSFYDSALTLLGTRSLNPTTGLSSGYWNAQFSADDTILYWKLEGGIGSILEAVNTSSFTQVGSVTAQFGFQSGLEPIFLWIESKRRAFFAAGGAVLVLDCNAPRSAKPYFLAPMGPDPFNIPLNQSAAITFTNSGIPLGTSVTIGGQLAPVESNNPNNNPVVVQVPASSVAGPVNLVFTRPDGEAMLEPLRFVYGADLAAATSTLVPPIGNPILTLYGYGILNGPSTPPTAPIVTIGGQPVTNLAVNLNADYILQGLFLQLPNGTPGPADIVVTSNAGTSTLKDGITYIPFATIIPATGLLQLLYDTHRSLLYALQSTQIQVFDPVSLKWTKTLRPGGSAGLGYVAMAITPDGSQLLVLDGQANTLTVFNPEDPSQSTPTALPSGISGGQNIATTSTGKAFIGGTHPDLEFDIATHTFKLLSSNTTAMLRMFVSTGDGTHMAAVSTGNSGGTVAVWHSSNDSFTTQGFSLPLYTVWSDLAISPDGKIVAPVAGGLGAAGVGVGFFDGQLHFTNWNVYPDLAPPDLPAAQGAIFSNSGLTLLTPLGDSIDFFDTQTGTLRGRLLMPSLLPLAGAGAGTPAVIALDPNQQTIYAITASGLAIVTLPSVVDQITPPAWPYVAKPPSSAPMFSGKRKAGALHFSVVK